MTETFLNLFELKDPGNFSCKYQIYHIDGLPKTDEYSINLNRLRNKVRYEIQQPISIIPHNGGHALAIPSSARKPELEQHLTPSVVSLVPSGEGNVDLNTITTDTSTILIDFVEFFIKSPLIFNSDLWSSQGRSFFWKKPSNLSDNSRNVDIFEGFSYSIHIVERKLYLSLDATTRYIDRYSLHDRLKTGTDPASLKWKNFLYFFGNQLYEINLVKVLERSIKDHKFVKDDIAHSIFDYTIEQCRQPIPEYIRDLDPNSPAILYRYPGNQKQASGAAALCKRTFKTDEPEVKQIHSRSIKKPEERFRFIQQCLDKAFRSTRFGIFNISIEKEPLSIPTNAFSFPDQIFGNNHVLHVKRNSGDSGIFPDQVGKERLKLIHNKEAGIRIRTPFFRQYLFVPESFPKEIHDDFKRQLVSRMQQFSTYPESPQTILYNDKLASNLHRQVDAISDSLKKNEINNGYALMVLPPNAHVDLHNFLKKQLWSKFQFQCAMANKILSFYEGSPGSFRVKPSLAQRYQSYIQNIALGMLQVNRKWPWTLATPLNYNAYVGLDVKNGMIGMTFVYRSGEQVLIRSEQSQQKEKLLSKMMRSIIYDQISQDIKNYQLNISSLVVHRDGRTYPEEIRGFDEAIRDLIKDGFVKEAIITGIVEIPKKSSRGLRLVVRNTEGKFDNPVVGSYFTINPIEGLVCNTGYPFATPGTVIPLHARIVHGNLDIKLILEDIFALSQLAWSAPDKSQRLPMTIKLIDDLLRSVAGTADENEARFG